MKQILSLFVLINIATANLNAQMVVEDPVAIAQDAMNQAVNLAKYVEMVNNQIQQIDTMTKSLEQVTAYTQAFGDPASLLSITGADDLVDRFNRFESGKAFMALQQTASGADALRHTANGLYRPIEAIQFGGREMERNTQLYRKHSALEATVSNYSASYDEAVQRAAKARDGLSRTTAALQTASTDAEVQKLQGVIATQSAELETIQHEVANAANHVLVQDVQNRNDSDKQDEARIEEAVVKWQHANQELDDALTLPGRREK